jgi:hypothetical protein
LERRRPTKIGKEEEHLKSEKAKKQEKVSPAKCCYRKLFKRDNLLRDVGGGAGAGVFPPFTRLVHVGLLVSAK